MINSIGLNANMEYLKFYKKVIEARVKHRNHYHEEKIKEINTKSFHTLYCFDCKEKYVFILPLN